MNFLQKLLYPVLREEIKAAKREAYCAGLRKGYELGTINGICKERNRAIITGISVEQQVNAIIERNWE